MDIDEPTNADLDRRLAELLEPEPVYVHDATHVLVAQMSGSPIRSSKHAWQCRCVYDEDDVPRWVPRPFRTDIAATWDLVRMLAKRGLKICLLDQLGYDAIENGDVFSDLWRAEFIDVAAHEANAARQSIWLGICQAPTAPLAISLAAEMALEKQAQTEVEA